MHQNMTALQGVDELDRALAESTRRPLLLFKHSYTCGTSHEALDELLLHLSDRDGKMRGDARDVSYAMVTVQTHRDVSNAVTSRLGVRHETPQALLIHDGKVVWSASHFRVTAESVEHAIKSIRSRRG